MWLSSSSIWAPGVPSVEYSHTGSMASPYRMRPTSLAGSGSGTIRVKIPVPSQPSKRYQSSSNG